MDFDVAERLRQQNASWSLLTVRHAPLILAFLGTHFSEQNRGPTPAAELAGALSEYLEPLNDAAASSVADSARFPRPASEYLDEWAAPEKGWLRRFYPVDSDEIHYDATAAFQRAYSWVSSLQTRAFVGTESRLQIIVELLRQIVHGAQTDPELRLAELRRRRELIDLEIAAVESGRIDLMTPSQVRDRYQQVATTARELLSDFREVEENFRALDRATRERIASWDGSKGEVLAELVGTRSAISESDQGKTFQAFYDFLLSERQQDELSELLGSLDGIAAVEADDRLRTIHDDWSIAADRTQQTVRQISEQLRRFLDDRVWLENRRVFDLIRSIEATALRVRSAPPTAGFELDGPGVELVLPVERPLYDARPGAVVDSDLLAADDEAPDASALFEQSFVDRERLLSNVRSVVPAGAAAQLDDILQHFPITQGAAELVAYLALDDDDIQINTDESASITIDFTENGVERRARMPLTTVHRRRSLR